MILKLGANSFLKNAAQVFLFRDRTALYCELILAKLTIQQYSDTFVKIPQNSLYVHSLHNISTRWYFILKTDLDQILPNLHILLARRHQNSQATYSCKLRKVLIPLTLGFLKEVLCKADATPLWWLDADFLFGSDGSPLWSRKDTGLKEDSGLSQGSGYWGCSFYSPSSRKVDEALIIFLVHDIFWIPFISIYFTEEK